MAPCRGGGAGGSSLSSLVPFPCLPAPCEARRQPSRPAPAEQPLCLERGVVARQPKGPVAHPVPPQASNAGGHLEGLPWGSSQPRLPRTEVGLGTPGEKVSPCLIVVVSIKVGHKGPASWVTLPPAICSGLGLVAGQAPARPGLAGKAAQPCRGWGRGWPAAAPWGCPSSCTGGGRDGARFNCTDLIKATRGWSAESPR